MTDHPLMACGHAANATTGNPAAHCCAICFGKPEAMIVADTPDLSGRLAECTYTRPRGGGIHPDPVPSSTSLAFFKHRPDQESDSYYCGCWGWS